jgi:phosphoadenosine phosphosulfate reductase
MSGHYARSEQVAEADMHLEIDAAAQQLADATPEKILAWAVEHFRGKLTMATAFGPEGCVMIDMIARHQWDVDIFTLDTDLFFPETYELWKTLEQRYGVRIRPVKGISLEEQEKVGHALWTTNPSMCCQLRKVKPLREELTKFSAWLSGIRKDQTAVRGVASVVAFDKGYGLYKVNPMLNLTEEDVWNYIKVREVPTNPLHERGYASIGCHPCTTPVQPGESARAGRWRGHGKTECGIHVSAETGALVRGPGGPR